MAAIRDYENAKAKYYESLALNSTSLVSIAFYGDFLNNYKKTYQDWQRLQTIFTNSKLSLDQNDILNYLSDDVVVVTDNELKILFASHNLSKMNGYREDEVIGKNPKMFQGPKTDANVSSYIRERVRQNLPFEAKIVNHKKNGKVYDCHIQGSPVFDKKGNLTHFIALEKG